MEGCWGNTGRSSNIGSWRTASLIWRRWSVSLSSVCLEELIFQTLGDVLALARALAVGSHSAETQIPSQRG